MCIFINITPHNLFSNLHYIPLIHDCNKKYFKYLQDDFSNFENDTLSYVKYCSPYFWVILDKNTQFMGFVSLDNFVGGGNVLYSAELTTCFEKQAWGSFTKYSAKIFLKKCFDELGLFKIKAQIFPDNFRIKKLLKCAGFEYESTLKSETLRNGKPQDIDIYSLYRTYYYN